ncbi:HD domain-containing protein [Streptomyces uncialis]|uniref:5'-deoxynucleotidase n=1 Tax=Streptomyces uncialis TaxID=1048205 RepID=A0A1Q4VD64_9ACTN|nr:HD domain-containing protein [Streptomyces uncialis]MCX4661024.1 HD domain-containing protein [Streptomyces uncialis]OKH95793.1 HAD family hydrolase [Streptomyces uncialis]WST68977.1 HD domain-containing protein [Streptomyces uncialis]WTE12375.1 HD domain-containing protein [Streptomyces uncialis]
MADDTSNARGTAGFLLEMGMLKRAKRSGWWIAGVKDPETIAEHSFRVALIASVLAMMEGADPAKAALLGLWHDTQETRVGDIPHIGRRYLEAASNEQVTADQVSAAHPAVQEGAQRIVDEYENGDSLEVIVAREADKLECLLQAVEYREQGCANVQPWIDSSLAKLKTASAQALAEAALNMTSVEWQKTYLR